MQERISNLRVSLPGYVTFHYVKCLALSRTNLLSPSQRQELRC